MNCHLFSFLFFFVCLFVCLFVLFLFVFVFFLFLFVFFCFLFCFVLFFWIWISSAESAAKLTDDRLEHIVQVLDSRQKQHLAIKLGCSPDEVYEKEPTAYLFIKWRRQQPKNVDVIKYMAAGLKGIGRKHLAVQVESKYCGNA